MPLNILKASAGSGKTFSLTRTYISYCLDPKNQIDFNNILAITFTKKATAEMKNRILQELFNLATDPIKSLHGSYFMETYGFNSEELAKRCKALLHQILQEYHQFSISTIDSFFSGLYQSVVLDLFKESQRDVNLNSHIILEKATQYLIREVDINSPLADLLQTMIDEKLIQGKGYNIFTTIQKLGDQLFRDEFAFMRNHHIFKRVSDDVYSLLTSNISEIESVVNSYKKEIETLLKTVNMTGEDFAYGKSSFVSIALKKEITELVETKRFVNMPEEDKWFKKSDRDQNEVVLSPIREDFLRLIFEFHHYVLENFTKYNSYQLIKDNYPSFMILSYLDKYIDMYCKDEGEITLNEINRQLYDRITNDDAAIIFEKLGQRYKSILIDEFQDTSTLQWNNLQPLIENCLYNKNPVLVVGDVKQSIYRFRDGDWRIMEYQTPQLQKNFNDPDFPQHHGNIDTLSHNWRSSQAVVETNNHLFSNLAKSLSNNLQSFIRDIELKPDNDIIEMIEAPRNIYRGIEQLLPENKSIDPGYVSIEYATFSGNKSDNTDEVLLWLAEQIETLASMGITGSKIGILCNTKKDCQVIGTYFTQKSKDNEIFQFASSDSLKLGFNEGIIILITALKIKCQIDEDVELQALYSFILKNKKEDWAIESMPIPTLGRRPEDIAEIKQLLELSIEQLYSFFESVIQVLDLHNEEDHYPYFLTFLELVKKFEKTYGSDIKLFLNEWEENISQQSIQSTAGSDKIQLMTMHKSKGLEFHTVLIPFGNWQIERSNGNTNLWVHSERDSFVELIGLVPLKYSNKMIPSYYTKTYFVEYVFNVVDSLNLLYVAMTRARTNLMVRLNVKERKGDSKSATKSLGNTVEFFNFVYPMLATESYIKGQLTPLKKDKEEKSNNSVKLKSFVYRRKPLSIVYHGLHKSNQGAIERGINLHHILQYLHSDADVERSIQLSEIDGVIREEDRDYWQDQITTLVSAESISPFFSNQWKVYTEKTMILPTGEEFRPDRVQENENEMVVIDYKSGKRSKSYKYQVGQYVKVLQQMVNKPVKGYLLYIDESAIEAV
ncbi:UvrD-helicase domain-containing protein [Membranihabitans marinus]|uniref:UvrD-helicase domain-containing protein n=1 Tax=Membranihabitans marinus TaxID=1227546 RepID=UPI001EFF8221|nr:UvrD-helicase domain-containing protein [Membranihabitans marinus]